MQPGYASLIVFFDQILVSTDIEQCACLKKEEKKAFLKKFNMT